MTTKATPDCVFHVYTRRQQPATRYVTNLDYQKNGRWIKRRYVTNNPGNRLIVASCCKKRRPAKNLTVQVYYDMLPFWCKPGKGCKR